MNDVVAVQQGGALTAADIKSRVNLIQQVMRGVMKDKTHYDTIPGTDKPSLLKPGAEVLCMTFQIAVDPEVQDLSTEDRVHFRVRAVGRHQATGVLVGVGIGECSSDEEKYKWKRANKREFAAANDSRKRVKYGYSKGQGEYEIQQVRTEPADVANTILKMAKKRALVDFTLTALAASDIFAQDLEDMPEELRETEKKQVKEPRAKAKKPDAQPEQPGPQVAGTVNAVQANMLRKKLEKSGKDEPGFCEHFGIKAVEELPMAKVNEGLQYAEGA